MHSDHEHSKPNVRVIQGTRDHFDDIQECVLELMQVKRYSEHDKFSVRVALEEALANAVIHGHQGD